MSIESANDDLTAAKRLIVREAARLFRRQGFSITTMRDVAEAVGLSKAGIYHHYRTKDQLLNDIVAVGADALTAQLHDVQQLDAPVEERLRAFFRTRMQTIADNQDVLTVIWQERPVINAETFSAVARQLVDYRSGVEDLVREGQRAGAIRPDADAHLLMLAIDGMTGWAYLWYRDGRGAQPAEIGEAFWSYLWDSVRAPE